MLQRAAGTNTNPAEFLKPCTAELRRRWKLQEQFPNARRDCQSKAACRWAVNASTLAKRYARKMPAAATASVRAISAWVLACQMRSKSSGNDGNAGTAALPVSPNPTLFNEKTMHTLPTSSVAHLADSAEITTDDGAYLQQAIAWSFTARDRGNRPFGAVVISGQGELLAEAYCNTTETGDCTGHAETNAVRHLGDRFSRSALAQATLYSSAEPCVMCAGAIFWSGIGRVVFGIDAMRLRVFRGERAEQRDAELSCRDVFAASPHPIKCIGPAFIEAASAPHIGFWKA